MNSKNGYYFVSEYPEIAKSIMLTPNARSVGARKYISRGINILPGISSNDIRVLRLFQEIGQALNSTLPIKRTPDGICEIGAMDANFGILSCAAGFVGTPGGYVQRDLTRRNLDLGITTPDGFLSPRHAAIFDKLLYSMCEVVLAGDLSVASKSSQGFPFCSYDKEQKVADAISLLRRGEEFLGIISSLDGRSILNQFGVIPLYGQNIRKSPDDHNKKRFICDKPFIEGKTDHVTPMDKSVTINGQLIEGISACRPRHVMGMNNPINILISTWRNGITRFYSNRYAFTWKHRGQDDLTDKINLGWNTIFGVDVSQFDNSVKAWHLESFIDSALRQNLFVKEFGDLLRRTFFAPVFQPETGDGFGAVFVGNPLTKDQLEEPGLLSGHDLVSFIGKFLNVFNLLTGIDEYMDVIENMDNILTGRSNFALLNAGDDCLVLCKDVIDRDTFISKCKYFKAEVETPISFLGYSLWKKGSKYEFHHNLVSFYKNTFIPERGFDSKLREYWYIGLSAKLMLFRETPYFNESLSIANKIWADANITGSTLSAYFEYLIDYNRFKIPHFVSNADQEFLANPNSIHYKISEDDVSPELLQQVFSAIPRAEYVNMMQPYFCNRINLDWN